MKYTEQTYKDIAEIQQLIKDKKLEDWQFARDIMNVSQTVDNEVLEYYKSIQGKYFKYINKQHRNIEYIYIHEGVKQYTEWDGHLATYVVEDKYTFCQSTGISFYKDIDHVISNTRIDRYKDYIQISKEEFDNDINELNNLVNISNDIYCKLAVTNYENV